MPKKILIAYASRAGSTGEVAQAIAKRLCAQGLDVDVRPVKEVGSLDGYQAVILGSAIRYSAWLSEMKAFVEGKRETLGKLPVAIFTCHMLALDDGPASAEARSGYTKDVRAGLSPRAEAFFAGKVDLAILPFFERLAVRLVKSPIGDKRDWDKIHHWADGLSAVLA